MSQADELLKSVKKAESRKGKGKLKIFMGMVAGVGKTYSMLKAAQGALAQGQKPVVGYVEAHGRHETETLQDGLEILPRKKLPYRDVTLDEFDLDGCLERKPKLVLVDELAHTNVPGSRHHKRWQDVLELLNNGIDVWTTLNVQHVESRAETIASITGVRVHELVPDSVIDRADDIVLIDLIPDEILTRLKEGKIYKSEKVDSATQNFFKVSNLTALREISLRLMAERVDHELKDISAIQGIANLKTHHRIIVAIFGSPYSESLIRYTRKMAYGLNCQWMAAYVNTRLTTELESKLLDKNIELVKQLGGEVVTTQNESVAEGLLHLAQQNGASQIIVGNSQVKWYLRLLGGGSLPEKLIKSAKGIDICVISPTEKIQISSSPKIKAKSDFEFDWRGVLATMGYLANLTFLNAVILPVVQYRAIGIIYLMGVTVGSLFIKRYNIYLAAVVGGLCWNVFFIPPTFTLHVEHQEDIMLLMLFIVAGIVIGIFTKRLQEKEEILRREGNQATQLYTITKELSNAEDLQALIDATLAIVDRLLGCPMSVFIRPWGEKDYDPSPEEARGTFQIPPKEEYALQWVIKNRLPAGKFTDTLPMSLGYYVPIISDKKVIGILAMNVAKVNLLTHDQKLILDAVARQLSAGIQRENLEGELRGKMVSEESERIYKTLLNSVSHEMRTPLAAIKGFASVLESSTPANAKEIAREIGHGVERLDYVVQNLLDMSRLESGNLRLNLDYHDVGELVRDAVRKVKRTHGERVVTVNAGKDLPLVFLDYFLIEQSIENIIRNAYLYSPAESPIEVSVDFEEEIICLSVTDNGPGIRGNDPSIVFRKFYRERPQETGGLGLGLSICKAIVELHHGTISAENVPGKGARFTLKIPRELDREIIYDK